MTKVLGFSRKLRKRGNPNFGRLNVPVPNLPTRFDKEVARLGLKRDMYVHSPTLRAWCEKNRAVCYIPEWLLKAWELSVEAVTETA
jgi:hypothetical protein